LIPPQLIHPSPRLCIHVNTIEQRRPSGQDSAKSGVSGEDDKVLVAESKRGKRDSILPSQFSPNPRSTSDCSWMLFHLSNGRQLKTAVITLYTADLTIDALHIPPAPQNYTQVGEAFRPRFAHCL
jgi:hypothetical protein